MNRLRLANLHLPTTPLWRTLAAAAFAIAHALVVVTFGVGYSLTWTLAVLPGATFLVLSPAARRRWYRWPLLWLLTYLSANEALAVGTLLLGQVWILAQWLGERHEQEPRP